MDWWSPVATIILLTDELLQRLDPEQIEAVMAHEVAHVRRAHLVWILLSIIAVVGLLSLAVDSSLAMIQDTVQAGTLLTDGVGVLIILIGAVLVFGFVSRRFEQQADAFAVQHLSGLERTNRSSREQVITPEAVHSMAGALVRVSRLNHSPVNRFTWRHGSIGGQASPSMNSSPIRKACASPSGLGCTA